MSKPLTRAIIPLLIAAISSQALADEREINLVPSAISHVYSDVEMRAGLALEQDAAVCSAEQCALNQAFDTQVKAQADRLTATAYAVYPDLKKRIPQFDISVADKKAAASASNIQGKIVLFRGIQDFELSDDAISFLLAREMGHVIAQHHDTNTKTKIMFSVLAGVLFPAVALVSATNVAAQASTASSVVTSLASSATSYMGSEAAISKIKPNQLIEADEVAIALTRAQGGDMISIAAELAMHETPSNAWLKDLHNTAEYLQVYAEKEAPTYKAMLAAP